MDGQRLLKSVWGYGSGRKDGIEDCSNVQMVVYAPRLFQNRVRRDSCSVEGLVPRRVTVVPAYLRELLGKPNLRLFHAK